MIALLVALNKIGADGKTAADERADVARARSAVKVSRRVRRFVAASVCFLVLWQVAALVGSLLVAYVAGATFRASAKR